MTKARRVRIRGAEWRLLLQRPPTREVLDGLCDYDTRTIYINPRAECRIGTTIHEVLHAALPDIDEEAILVAEDALVKALEVMPSL